MASKRAEAIQREEEQRTQNEALNSLMLNAHAHAAKINSLEEKVNELIALMQPADAKADKPAASKK